MDNINIIYNDFKFKTWLQKVVRKLCVIENLNEEDLSIVIIDDKQMQNLNNEHRQKNEPTDVLTFAECDAVGMQNDGYLGEIFINFDQVQRQSEDWKKEIVHLLVHGYLHTKGYIHDTDQNRGAMDRVAGELIKKIEERNGIF